MAFIVFMAFFAFEPIVFMAFFAFEPIAFMAFMAFMAFFAVLYVAASFIAFMSFFAFEPFIAIFAFEPFIAIMRGVGAGPQNQSLSQKGYGRNICFVVYVVDPSFLVKSS